MSFRPPVPRPKLVKKAPKRKPGPALTANTAPNPPAKPGQPCK